MTFGERVLFRPCVICLSASLLIKTIFFSSGYLGPGGIQDGKEFFDCVGGMTGYVDRLVLGVNHIYQYPTSGEVFKSGPFDPEGILGPYLSLNRTLNHTPRLTS